MKQPMIKVKLLGRLAEEVWQQRLLGDIVEYNRDCHGRFTNIRTCDILELIAIKVEKGAWAINYMLSEMPSPPPKSTVSQRIGYLEATIVRTNTGLMVVSMTKAKIQQLIDEAENNSDG